LLIPEFNEEEAGKAKKLKLYCVFCATNGELQEVFNSPILKDPHMSTVPPRIVCPALFMYTCDICGILLWLVFAVTMILLRLVSAIARILLWWVTSLARILLRLVAAFARILLRRVAAVARILPATVARGWGVGMTLLAVGKVETLW